MTDRTQPAAPREAPGPAPTPPPRPAETGSSAIESPLFRGGYRVALKRTTDVICAAAALVVLSPAMLLIAIAIRLDSPGSVIFHQVRVGRNRRRLASGPPDGTPDRRRTPGFGREFHMFKFRTMRRDAPKYSTSPRDGTDARVTRVGRVLRKSSLDELPQIFNVLRGDMSLVGPRPEMPFIVETYGPVHLQRLLVTPGLTGPWQLHGPRSKPMHEAIEWDLQYIQNWSPRLDAKIIMDTIFFVARARNF